MQRLDTLRQQYPDIIAFSNTFNPANNGRFAAYPERCLTGSAPTLTDLRLAYPGAAHIQWTIAQLMAFQENVNIPNKMSTYQLEACAQAVCDSFAYLKTTELMLFFTRLAGGLYPVQWYGSVSPDKIIAALRDHFVPWRNKRLDEIHYEEQRQREQLEHSNAITWEEYLARHGEEYRPSPLDMINHT